MDLRIVIGLDISSGMSFVGVGHAEPVQLIYAGVDVKSGNNQ